MKMNGKEGKEAGKEAGREHEREKETLSHSTSIPLAASMQVSPSMTFAKHQKVPALGAACTSIIAL